MFIPITPPPEPFPEAGDTIEFIPPLRIGCPHVRAIVRRVIWPLVYLTEPPPDPETPGGSIQDAVYPRACMEFRWRSPGGHWRTYRVKTYVECLVCGLEIDADPHRPHRKYCSDACAAAANTAQKRRDRDNQLAEGGHPICSICRRPFLRQARAATVCTRPSCRAAVEATHRVSCYVCHAPVSGKGKTCSPECAKIQAAARRQQRRHKKRVKP